MIRRVAGSPRWAVAGLALVWAVVLFAVLRPASWAYDDWLYFALSHQQGPTSSTWLGSIYFQHFAPGHRLATSAVAGLMPVDYRWFLALFLLCLAGSAVLFARCADLLWGRRWAHVAGAVVLVISSTHVHALIWWSAGLQMLPTLLLELVCLYGFLRFRATGQGRWHALSVGAMALGLLFYIRPLAMPVYLVLIEAAFLAPSLRPRAIARQLWERRTVWLSYALVAAVYLAYWLGRGAAGDAPAGQSVTLHLVSEYVRIAWLRDYAPRLLGVGVAEHATTGQNVAVVLAQLLIAAFAVWTIVRRRSAWRAWAFLAVAGTISLVVTASRIRNFGPSIGYDTRYMVELTWLFPLAVCGALAPSPARRAEAESAAAEGRARRPAIRILAPVAVALLVVAVLSARTARDEERAFGGETARAYIDRLQAGVARLPPGTTVADRDVPAQTLPAWTNLGQLHNVMPFVDDGIPVDGPAPQGVAMVDDSGAVRVAEVQPALGGAAVALQRAGALTTPGAAAVHRRAGALCVTATPEAVTRITLRGARPVSAPQLYLLVDATATPAPIQVGATIDAGAGQGLVATTPTPLTLGATGGPSVLWLRTATAAGAGVDVPAGATLCVRSLTVGPLVARGT